MTDETKQKAEAWAKGCIHDRGNPHWHDLRDGYLAGHDAGVAKNQRELEALRRVADAARVLWVGQPSDERSRMQRALWFAVADLDALKSPTPSGAIKKPVNETDDSGQGGEG